MADGSNHAFSLPAATSTIPQFALRDLHEWLDGMLNESTTGTVYSLRGHPSLAVKKVPLDNLDKSNMDTIKTRLATLLDLSHPGILKHHQVVEDEGLIYVITDRHDKTLERLLTDHKRRKIPMSAGVILSVMKQIAAALAYLHGVNGAGANGLVHRDLRPANIFISADGERFIIAGLDLCRNALRGGSITAITRSYMAPEALLHNKASPASDVWSLGVIIYELVTLRMLDFLEDREPAEVFVDGWRPDLSGVTDGFIKSILERIFVLEPKERLTARELHKTLATFDIPVGELGHRCVALEGKCSTLETALNSANARIAILEAALDARSTEIASLKDALENRPSEVDALGQEPRLKTTGIGTLEGRIKALEDKFAQLDAVSHLTKLIRAVHMNNTEAVRMLVNEGTGIGQCDEQGMTALMHAAQRGHVESVKLLAEKEKGLQDRNGWTALMHATHGNHSEVAKVLAPHEHGKRDNNGRTALMIATQQGSLEMVKLLLDHEKGLRDKDGNTAFMYALKNQHTDIALLLREHEAPSWTPLMCAAFTGDATMARRHLSDKDTRNGDGETALMIAARKGYREIIELLDPTDEKGVTALMRAAARGDTKTTELLIHIQGGTKDNDGSTALMHALRNRHRDTAMVLREYEASSWTPLMRAALAGDVTTVKEHLSDKDTRNSDGDTALTIAARAGHRNIVELLDPTDDKGVTALMRAVDRNDVDTVKALLPLQGGQREFGSFDIDIDNRIIMRNGTALMRAAAHGHTRIVEILLEKEGGMRGSYGWTALMLAAWNNKQDCVKLLVKHKRERGALGWTNLICAACIGDADAVRSNLQEAGMRGSNGWTALMLAAANGYSECAKLLLEKEGCMQRSYGQTALILAARKGNPDCIKLFLEKEGGMADYYGWTALMWAVSCNQIECARLLAEKEKNVNRSKLLEIVKRRGNREILALLSK